MIIPSEWVEKADAFFMDAKRHVNDGLYWLSCFESQRATELYLKGLIIAKAGTYPFTHDLAELLRVAKSLGFDFSNELYVHVDALSGEYTLSRYPGRKPRVYNDETARRWYARRIIEWVRSVEGSCVRALVKAMSCCVGSHPGCPASIQVVLLCSSAPGLVVITCLTVIMMLLWCLGRFLMKES